MCRPCFKAVSLIYDALLAVRVTPLYPESFFAKIRRNLTRKRTSSSSLLEERRILWERIDVYHPDFFSRRKNFCLVGLFSRKNSETFNEILEEEVEFLWECVNPCIMTFSWWDAKILPYWMGYNFLREVIFC